MAIAYWLGTYLVHSTVLLGLAWVCDRFRLLRSPARREQAWRAALAGSLLTATLQTGGLTGPTLRLDLLSFRTTSAKPAPVAEARAERLLAGGGPERLLQEVEAAAGAHSRAAYLGAPLGKTERDAARFHHALESAGKIESSFGKRTVLGAIAKCVVGDAALQRRYREIARGMSEFERGQALTALDDAMPS